MLFAVLFEEDDEDGVLVEKRAELRVRDAVGVSALPLTSWGDCFRGTVCLRDGGREGGGDGSFFAVTLEDTRLFLSGLDAVLLAGESLLLLLLFMA